MALSSLLAQVEQVPALRVWRKSQHFLSDILVIATGGVPRECDGGIEIAKYRRRKADFFRTAFGWAKLVLPGIGRTATIRATATVG